MGQRAHMHCHAQQAGSVPLACTTMAKTQCEAYGDLFINLLNKSIILPQVGLMPLRIFKTAPRWHLGMAMAHE